MSADWQRAPVPTTSAELREARQDVLATAQAMRRSGLSPGRSGNISRRCHAGMLITPSGMPYDGLCPDDIVRVADDGRAAAGQRRPSSEWHVHLAAYRARASIGAVVHTHSLHATVLACAHRPIPAFHYMVAVAGGDDIPLVPYATFGSEALARYVAQGLLRRNACLLANHGQVAVGVDCAAALELAHEVEVLAEQYCKVLAIGAPYILDSLEMQRVSQRLRSHGQPGQS